MGKRKAAREACTFNIHGFGVYSEETKARSFTVVFCIARPDRQAIRALIYQQRYSRA